MVASFIITGFLIWGSVWDLKKKCIPFYYLYCFGGVVVCYLLIKGLVKQNVEILLVALKGAIPGGISLLLSYVSKEQIGYGDGVVIVFIGMLLGISKVVGIFWIALLLLVFFSVCLLIAKKAKKKTEVPFLPFLLLGNILMSLI